MFRKIIVTIVLCMVIQIASFAQDDEFNPKTVLYFVDLSEEPVEEQISTVLINRVVEEVGRYSFDVISDPITAHEVLSSDADTMEINNSSSINVTNLDRFYNDLPLEDTDIVISAFFRVQRTALLIQFTLYDPATQTGVGGVFTRARTGLTLFTSVNEAVLELRPTLENYLENRYQYIQPEGKVERILIAGEQEGIQVFFAGRDVGRIQNGELLVPFTPFNVGTYVRMELRKVGYHEDLVVVDLDEPILDLKLPWLYKKHRFALQSYWTLGLAQGYGLAFNVFVDPDQSFFQIYHHRHIATYNIDTIYDVWNYEFGFYYGQYILFPPQSFLRLYIGAGIGGYVTTVNNASVSDYLDIYLNLINPTLEINFDWIQFFTRLELKYAIGVGNNFLGRNWIQSASGIPPISFGVQLKW